MRALVGLRMGKLCARSLLMWIAAWQEGQTHWHHESSVVPEKNMNKRAGIHNDSGNAVPRTTRNHYNDPDMYEQQPGMALELASSCVKS